MNSQLKSLLGLRQREEESAEHSLAAAIAHHTAIAHVQRQHDERAAAAKQRFADKRQQGAGSRAASAGELLGAERFLKRLEKESDDLAGEAEGHRKGPLAAARAGEDTARARHLAALREREALEKHIARQETEAHLVAGRRAEDAAGDLSQSAHVRAKRS